MHPRAAALRQRRDHAPWRAAAAAGLAAFAGGCSIGLTLPGPALTEADFAAIRPGMSSREVLSRVGPPSWTFGVRQENLTIWNYRYNPLDCVIYQVSVRPDGTVRDAGTGWDPRCDDPGGFWR